MPRKQQTARAARTATRAVMPGFSTPAPLPTTSGPALPMQMSFTNGTDGRTGRLAWTRYSPPWNLSGPYVGGNGGAGGINRDRNLASVIATDFATTNSTVATLIENLGTHNLGTGLTLSSKLDAASLGITAEEARALSSEIEKKFKRWASNPVECDLAGRHTLHELALAGFKSYLMTGELLALLNWQKMPGATSRTKVQLLDSRQLDQTKTILSDGLSTVQGVTFNSHGRVVAYFIVPLQTGKPYTTTQSQQIAAFTSWGRPKVIHLYDLVAPGQIRGISPLTAALTPSQEKATLGEFTLDSALLQTQYALTIESDLPSSAAFNGLRVENGLDGEMPAQPSYDPIGGRLEFYSQSKITAQPGVINHLAPGDKLKINRSETPNATFGPFDKSLMRAAAKAAGSSFEDTSGDYSDTSFSASRLALETPYRINLRRRGTITEKFYRAVFSAWLEEQIETQQIVLPKNALPFYAARDAYTAAKWLGSGRISPDPLKTAQATALELEQGLTTLADALAERGLDLEEVIEQRKAERDMLIAAGLPLLPFKSANGRSVDQPDDEETADNTTPSKRK